MPVEPYLVRRFALADDPTRAMGTRGKVVAAIERSQFTLEYIKDELGGLKQSDDLRKADSFGLFVRPQASAKTLYGLDREVLVWVSTHSSFQARDIENLRRTVDESGARLSRQFAVLLTRYDPATRSSLESEGGRDQTLVHVSLEELYRIGLDAILAKHLYSRDLFDVSGATVRAAEFFGRRETIDRIVTEIQSGTSQTGVFGLRKVGKTSLLNRIADRIQNTGSINVAHLDLQYSVSINPRPEYTLWALGSAIHASHRSVRAIAGFRLFGSTESFSDLRNPESVWEWFAQDMQRLLTQNRRNLCILIDEVERMYERPEDRGFVRFWRLLRGLDQQNPGRLRYVLGGTSPQCAEVGTIADEDNPLFRYLRLEFLGPLAVPDARTLLTNLGGPMGLKFDESSLKWALVECGGHPALLRNLGSTIHNEHRERVEPIFVNRESLLAAAEKLRQRNASVLDQMLAALEDHHNDEFVMLELLAEGQIFQFREYARVFGTEVQHLRNYGLIETGETPHLSMAQLHSHLVSRAGKATGPQRASTLLSVGDKIGPWTVKDCISSGAYGDVYRVEALQQMAAAKVLKGGQLSVLQREVEILKELQHPNIVRITDALRADDGSPVLIMELLQGEDLRHRCTPSTRPLAEEWLAWLAQILEALEYMHPKSDRIVQLEQMETLSSSEFVEWDQARHGYVHRDIKPENIMLVPDRGPVLVDFNIAVRAGAPVQTTSATPGYLPPLLTNWEPCVDLYSLGVTFTEVVAGLRLANASLGELTEIARARCSPSAAEVLDVLLQAPESGTTARQVRQLVARVPRNSGVDSP